MTGERGRRERNGGREGGRKRKRGREGERRNRYVYVCNTMYKEEESCITSSTIYQLD